MKENTTHNASIYILSILKLRSFLLRIHFFNFFWHWAIEPHEVMQVIFTLTMAGPFAALVVSLDRALVD